MAGYLAQAAGFVAAGTALSGYALYNDIKSSKRKFPDEGFYEPVAKKGKMAFRSRRFGRRRFGRRRFGRRRFRKRVPFKRRRFTKAVRRVIRRTAEPKVQRNPENITGLTLTQGDGTTRVIYVSNPPGGMIQGSEADELIGDRIFLKGISLRGQVGTSGENTTFQGAKIRISCVWSKEQGSALDGAWTIFGSTTTPVANPTQIPPFVNPRFFESSNANLVFVGNGWTIPFDTRGKVRVLRSYTIQLNPGVENQADGGIIGDVTPFDLWFPINKWMRIEDPDQLDISSPFRFKYGTYYLVMQVVSNTNDVSNTAVGEMDYSISTYYCQP